MTFKTVPYSPANPIPLRFVALGDGTFALASVPTDDAGNVLSTVGGGAITIANGSDHAEGATTDAAVTTDTDGTLSAKLRGLVVLSRKGGASAPTAVPVDDTAGGTSLLAANPNRISAIIQNADATNTVYLGMDGSVTAANGLLLPGGSTFSDDRTTGAWFGICSAGRSASVRILEVS